MALWQVLLRAEIAAYVKIDDEWDDPEGIGAIAADAVSLFPPSDDAVSLELETVTVEDVLRQPTQT